MPASSAASSRSIFANVGPIVAVDRESVDLADADQTRALRPPRRARPYSERRRLHCRRSRRVRTCLWPTPSTPRLRASSPKKPLERNALLVHYSTDYVFDGSKTRAVGRRPTCPHPLNVYGASKLAGEQAVENVGGKYLIFRTSWVYGPHGNNFLLTMLRLARERDRLSIVDDQIGAPTTSIELARATHAIVTGILAGRFGAAQDWPASTT